MFLKITHKTWLTDCTNGIYGKEVSFQKKPKCQHVFIKAFAVFPSLMQFILLVSSILVKAKPETYVCLCVRYTAYVSQICQVSRMCNEEPTLTKIQAEEISCYYLFPQNALFQPSTPPVHHIVSVLIIQWYVSTYFMF